MECSGQIYQICVRAKVGVGSIEISLGVAVVRSTSVRDLLCDRGDPDSIETHSLLIVIPSDVIALKINTWGEGLPDKYVPGYREGG